MAQLKQRSYSEGAGDSLFASNGVKSIPADGYTLAASVVGVLPRGLPLKQGATAFELTPVTADEDVTVGILADETDVTIGRAAAVYQEGEFNKYAVQRALTAFESSAKVDGLALLARDRGIYFKDVIKSVV